MVTPVEKPRGEERTKLNEFLQKTLSSLRGPQEGGFGSLKNKFTVLYGCRTGLLITKKIIYQCFGLMNIVRFCDALVTMVSLPDDSVYLHFIGFLEKS
jgi:hypothetical protein